MKKRLLLCASFLLAAGSAIAADAENEGVTFPHTAYPELNKAYAYIEQRLNHPDNFFLFGKDLIAINAFFLSKSEEEPARDAFRTDVRIVDVKPLLCARGESPYLVPMPSFDVDDPQNAELLEQWQELHKTYAWFNTKKQKIRPNWDYIDSASEEQLTRELQWAKDHIYVHFPHTIEDLLNSRGPNCDATWSSKVNGREVSFLLQDRLDTQMRSLHQDIENARGNPSLIIEVAAKAHLDFYALSPFEHENRAVAHVLMNTILRRHGLPAVDFDEKDEDWEEYFFVLRKDLVSNSTQNMKALLHRKILELQQ